MPEVLLVEDNAANRDMLSRRLQRRGYTVEVAVNGVEAVEKARALQPDLILMDLGLPEVDGWEATRRIREDPRAGSIPIVALTAHAMVADRERALSSGFDDFATKPVDFTGLLTILDRLTGASAGIAS